jgi:hypothetical protein
MPYEIALIESAQMLKAGVESVSDRVTVGHVPGQGLFVVAEWLGDMDFAKTQRRLRALVMGMAPTLEGLDDGEWVTLAWLGTEYSKSPRQLVIKMRPSDPNSLEVFVDGVVQE